MIYKKFYMNDDELFNLKIGRNSAYDILKTGMIKTIKIGKKYIIPKQSVINFLADIN